MNSILYVFRSDALFELWNKYEPKLPEIYYQEKLLQMGDFLMTVRVFIILRSQTFFKLTLKSNNCNNKQKNYHVNFMYYFREEDQFSFCLGPSWS